MAWRANLSRSVKEIRFLFCQSSPDSAPAREFVKKNYRNIKARNPSLPVLVRECSSVEPQLWARYDMGVERCVRLDGLTEVQIDRSWRSWPRQESRFKLNNVRPAKFSCVKY